MRVILPIHPSVVIPTKAGTQEVVKAKQVPPFDMMNFYIIPSEALLLSAFSWIPAFAGMTRGESGKEEGRGSSQ